MRLHRGFNVHIVLVAFLLFAYFAGGYALLAALHRHTPQGINAAIWLDHVIPLWPPFIVFYLIGDLFVFAGIFLIRDQRTFDIAAAVMAGMLTVAFLTFYFVPIEMHKEIATGADIFSRWTRFQQVNDTTFNSFPSLHVTLNTFAYLVMVRERPRLRKIFLPILVLIILSTLFVKQHLVIDVIGGLALAFGGYAVFLKLLRRA